MTQTRIEPNWLAGFVDGEGSFYIGINSQPGQVTGFQVLPEFRIVQHERDVALIQTIRTYFGHGQVVNNRGQSSKSSIIEYRVRTLKALSTVIVPFFKRYELRTQKRFDFLAFSEVIGIMEAGGHLTVDGLVRIRSIKARMNRSRENKDKVRS